MTNNETHVLEWSQKQNAMHIHPVAVAIEKNLQLFFANRSSDFIVLYTGNRSECNRVKVTLMYKLQARDPGLKRDRRRN